MPKSSDEFSKAGVLVHGLNAKRERSMLVPYNEGRFDESGTLYYVLPKGSIDEGESVFDAALRETKEETGIDIIKMLCATPQELKDFEKDSSVLPKAAQDMRDGKPLAKHFESAGYPGVRVVEIKPKPYIHKYLSRASVPNKLAMFDIEIEGIDALAKHPDLKNSEGKKNADLISDPKRPKFPLFIDWLKKGELPNGDTLCDAAWFTDLAEKHSSEKAITTREGWQKFCSRKEGVTPEEYKKLRKAFHKIKEFLKSEGWLGDDNGLLKFDEKDCPLFWYTEGAGVKREREFVATTFHNMSVNPDFACAFGGQCDAVQEMLPELRILHSQFAAIGPFVDPNSLRQGLEEAIRRNGGKPLHWGKPPEGIKPTPEPTIDTTGYMVVGALLANGHMARQG